jgi:Uncharacterized protein conserved in bacteria (DUF2252)
VRKDVRRSAHGDWEPAPDRPDPIELLEEQARTRIPELVPIRYGRMLLSPLAFYRGAAYVMSSDLAHTPRMGLRVHLSGDAHLSNFGVYAAPDRRLVFSVNDFDETLPGPFGRIERNLAKRRARDNLRAFAKLTEVVDGERRIVSDPPLIVPIEELVASDENEVLVKILQKVLRSYRRTLTVDRKYLLERFRYGHVARKVVGVGSVGLQAWIVLSLGRDDQDPLFLQLKEAQPSVLEPFLGKSEYANHGQRVVEGQRLTQAAQDVLLGWTRGRDVDSEYERDYYVRQLWDGKASGSIDAMDPETLTVYAEICGWTLAHAHARSGDPVALAGYLGRGDAFDRAVASLAETYADQNERDFAALETAAADGRIPVERGL